MRLGRGLRRQGDRWDTRTPGPPGVGHVGRDHWEDCLGAQQPPATADFKRCETPKVVPAVPVAEPAVPVFVTACCLS